MALHDLYVLNRCILTQEIDENEQKYVQAAAKEDEVLAEIDKPPKTHEFWTELKQKIQQNDIDFVKDLIRSKKLTVDEVSSLPQLCCTVIAAA